MSLKKKLFTTFSAAFWLSSSYAAFVQVAETRVGDRTGVDKTLGRRVALVASGPLLWNAAGPAAVVMTTTDFVTDFKKAATRFKKNVNNFFYEPPKR